MSETKKSSNIYLNPMFNDVKSVIHINPKVHLNMAIHVNPKMVNVFSSTTAAKLNQIENKNNQSLIQKSSIHVNPKLMEKLKKPQVPEITTHCKKTNPMLQYKSKNLLSLNHKNSPIKKASPSKLVSLSKNKLIRVRPTSSAKINLSTASIQQPTKKVQKPVKVINISQLKKVKVCSDKSVQLSRNRYKIDRTKVEKRKSIKLVSTARKGATRNNTNLIKIDGVLYKTSKSQLVRSKPDQKKANRTSLTNLTIKNKYKLTKAGAKTSKTRLSSAKSNSSRSSITMASPRANYKHIVSNRAKQKSIQILRQKMTKNNQTCLLFRRFGFCAKFTAGTCPKVHDKKQVALCKNFLQGKCLLDNCPLSHEVGPEKMPTCKYFLDGCCVRENCQYLHVKVSSNTSICKSFLQGYCEKGTKCKERHINICPEFEKIGKCTKGKNCPYPHKSSLLVKHKINSKKTKLITIFNKQKNSLPLEEIASLPRVDDTKKRYYDDNSCFNQDDDNDLIEKRLKLLKRIDLMKSVQSNDETNDIEVIDISSDSESTVVNQNIHQLSKDFSQPSSKRSLIGPLPAYIPI